MVYNHDGDNPFAGPPRYELDVAWSNLMRGVFDSSSIVTCLSLMNAGTVIRLTEEDLSKANTSALPLKNGGYAGGLSVFHELHCIVRRVPSRSSLPS